MTSTQQKPETSVPEHLSILLCFVYSRLPLENMAEKNFHPEWKTRNQELFDSGEQKALHAMKQLAGFLKDLETEGKVDQLLNGLYRFTCGNVKFCDQSDKALSFEDIGEKLEKSARMEWRFPEKGSDPAFLICHSSEPQKWLRAEIDLQALTFVCGGGNPSA